MSRSIDFCVTAGLQERKQVEELVAKIAEEDAKEAKARSDKQVEFLGWQPLTSTMLCDQLEVADHSFA